MNSLIKSKTVWGGILIGIQPIIDGVVQLGQAGALGPKVQGILTGLGIILGAVGVRSAISKNGKK